MIKKPFLLLAILTICINASAQELSEVEQAFLKNPSSERFKNHLKELTKAPHPSGTEESKQVINYMKNVMESAGLEVTLHDYDIYFPAVPGENIVELVSPVQQTLNNKETVLDEDPFSSDARISHGWNSYSGEGDVTREVVYVNFGRREDFQQLEAMGVSIKDKIAVARYGGNFRGFKAKYAEQWGAAGLIIYTDPADAGYMRGLPYPEGQFYSENTIQRGSVLTLDFTGDPLTPFEPALPLDGKRKVERLDPKDVAFHTIPVTPLSYGSAKEILSRMAGQAVPNGWQGGLPFTYRIEGGADLKVRLKVTQEKKFNRVTNVVGTLKGSEFPDEWVILGSHHDPWTFGASDPNSGTAMLLSLAESLGQLAKDGYRPKRTIKIAHWDAEEHGILGSVEWVEEFRDELTEKAVAYINGDGAVSGPNFGASSSPTLKTVLLNAAGKVDYPKSEITVLEKWKGEADQPRIGNLGGGSDHVGFYAHLGIPSMNAGSGGPTLYHSGYDDFYWYSKHADPDFKYGPMVESVVGLAALELANNPVIPYALPRYAEDFKTHLGNIEAEIAAFQEAIDFNELKATADQVAELSKDVIELIEVKKTGLNKKQLTKLNQQLIKMEKAFIHMEGMPFGKWYRSVFGAPDPYSGYASWMLPALKYYADAKDVEGLKKWEGIYQAKLEVLSDWVSELMVTLEE
ncbi:MAG: M28 family metallopeptidase [Cyclobacteriaceae bacterium]